MEKYLQLVTVFSSGVFALLVTSITLWFNQLRDSASEQREEKRLKISRIEELYISYLSQLFRIIRATHERDPYEEFKQEIDRMTAMMRIMCPMPVILESENLSDLIYAWTLEFKKGQPEILEGTDHVMISSSQTPHREKAKELFPELNEQFNTLINEMKAHLESMKGEN